ncbi:Mariner Mos1 transposase [Eumeta japonica]|uniref:Mariner Mos1 transposase n=1 Tax=Eumeta variegata TaxID=151549 RepID=A0A4C1SKK3_EUMVA|nr:Mariner Mos1 transposase [Eumeta japonica]
MFDHGRIYSYAWRRREDKIVGRAKLEPVMPPPCRLSWLTLAAWPAAAIVGLTAQYALTGIGIYHEQTEAHRLLVEAYNEAALNERICCERFQKFRNSDFDIDKDRSGRSKFAELKKDSSQIQKKFTLTLEVTQGAVSHRIKSLRMSHKQSIGAQKRRLKAQQSRPQTREQRAEMKQRKYRYLYQVRTAHGDVISQSYVQALQKKAQCSSNWSGNGGGGECSTLQSDSTHLTVLAGSEQAPHTDSDDDLNQIRPAH